MKPRTLLILLMCIGHLFSMAQVKSKKVDILWGPELSNWRKSTLSDFIGYDETGIYALKTRYHHGMVLEHHANDMRVTKSVKLELKENGKPKNLELITQFNGELLVFSSFADQKLKKNSLYVQGVNKRTLQLKNDLRKVGEIDYAGNSEGNVGSYNFVLSRGRTKLLIYYNLPYQEEQNERLDFHVLDKELNLIWEKKVILPHREELFEVEDCQLDDSGNVYLSGVLYKDKRKSKRKGLPNYEYRILAYLNNGTRLNEYPITDKEKFLTDMKISITDNGDIICGGFYSEQGNFSINGSYFLKFDGNTKGLLSKSFKAFGIDFITQYLTEKEERKALKKEGKGADNELFSYDLNEFIIKADGGAILIGEQYFVKELNHARADGQGGVNYFRGRYYYYNDIIVINISPDGQLKWTEKIPKKQRTYNDRGFYSSYALSIVGDKLYFVFNDHPNNLFYKGFGEVHTFNPSKESVVVLVEVDKAGKQTREALFSAKPSETLVRPSVCRQTASDELVLFSQRKKTQQLARVFFLE